MAPQLIHDRCELHAADISNNAGTIAKFNLKTSKELQSETIDWRETRKKWYL